MEGSRNPLQKGGVHKEVRNVERSILVTKSVISPHSRRSAHSPVYPGSGPMIGAVLHGITTLGGIKQGNNSPETA